MDKLGETNSTHEILQEKDSVFEAAKEGFKDLPEILDMIKVAKLPSSIETPNTKILLNVYWRIVINSITGEIRAKGSTPDWWNSSEAELNNGKEFEAIEQLTRAANLDRVIGQLPDGSEPQDHPWSDQSHSKLVDSSQNGILEIMIDDHPPYIKT